MALRPGAFTLGAVGLARRAGQTTECCYPPPADVVVTGSRQAPEIHCLHPKVLPTALATSNPAPALPILRTDEQAKPLAGFWLTAAGWQAHLQGQPLDAARRLIHSGALWQTETRLGIALNESTRSAADGALYTSDAVAMHPDTGFCVTVHGADGALDATAPLAADPRTLAHRARGIDCAAPRLRWYDWARNSARQKQRIPMGGIVGSLELAGDLGPLWPWLWAGQWLHVGKGAVMGLGRYRLIPA